MGECRISPGMEFRHNLLVNKIMKDKLNKLFFSRTFWTIALMFVIGGVQAIEQTLAPGTFIALQGVLSLVATYFKLNPSQNY